jgi:hypothetical protein
MATSDRPSPCSARDIEWHVCGRHLWLVTEDFMGRDAVVEFLARMFDGCFRIGVNDALASDRHAVVLGTMTGKRNGKTFEQKFTHVFPANGEVAEEFWHLSMDQDLDDGLWSQRFCGWGPREIWSRFGSEGPRTERQMT